ncbi:metallophosphoesterase [Motilimonas pumila]|uniref:metallophosphoesterase n=1 Tax=Motilimonas pumila TaxID=2303987 RepID=UPI0013145132|nr:metallophosphoesterase [Motilimonas pumila]
MTGFDVIGDVHGRADLLLQLLQALGYKMRQGAYQHADNRQAVFIGDMIDGGNQQRQTLRIIRDMVNAGSALAILGNHEFNAISFATLDPADPSRYLRVHNVKNCRHHRAFLDEFPPHGKAYQDAIDWLSGLPLYLEKQGVAFIHACWRPDLITGLQPYLSLDNSMTPELLLSANRPDSVHYETMALLLKGPELTLPAGYHFNDKHGVKRNDIRLKWWARQGSSYRDLAAVPYSQIMKIPDIPLQQKVVLHQTRQRVFIGHYSMHQTNLSLDNRHVACVDFSGNKQLAAYRWSGEESLTSDNLLVMAP